MSSEEQFQPASLAAWRAWLKKNHARSAGVWLVSWKKASGRQAYSYEEAVEEALCYGWIDSKPRALDAERAMLWFAPRKPGAGWSAHNKRRVAKLLAQSRMAPAGLAKVESARRDGSWTKLDAIESLQVPPDLQKAFSAAAAKNFDAFPRSVKRGILEWIAQAKKAETRAARVRETARLAAKNQRANQWRG